MRRQPSLSPVSRDLTLVWSSGKYRDSCKAAINRLGSSMAHLASLTCLLLVCSGLSAQAFFFNGRGAGFKRKTSRQALSLAQDYDLVVWDCDGVLVDSEALLKKGEVDALAKLGYSLTTDDCTRLFSGVSVDKAMENFEAEMGSILPPTFFKEQIDGSIDLFRRELQPLMADTVTALFDSSIPMCVASGSPRDRVLLSLEVGGMGHCFKETEVFTRELVSRGKPAPDLFLYSAEKMGVKPERCIVIEDSTSGIEAAIAAGMKCISYMGGSHAKDSWYRDKIMSFDVTHTYTSHEVLAQIIGA